MEFKQINTFPPELKQSLFQFMITSKPFDFCEHKSYQIRKFNINKYISFLEKSAVNYAIYEGDQVMSLYSWEKQKEEIQLLFLAFFHSNNKKAAKNLQFATEQIKTLYPDIRSIYSLLSRLHKRKKMISWILKYSPDAKIVLDKIPNCVYFYDNHGIQK